jgi:serine/threonine protein kinase
MDLRDQLQHALGSPYRKVAVKVLRPELAPALGADRFIREIRIAARLRHSHILPLLDPGQAEGRAPVHEAVRLLVEISDALAFIVFSSGMAPYQTPVVGAGWTAAGRGGGGEASTIYFTLRRSESDV